MSTDTYGTGWLYRRLDAASAEIDKWTEEKRSAINYVFHSDVGSNQPTQPNNSQLPAETKPPVVAPP